MRREYQLWVFHNDVWKLVGFFETKAAANEWLEKHCPDIRVADTRIVKVKTVI